MNALQVVALILLTIAGLAVARFLAGVAGVWLGDKIGLCGLCHKRRAEYWFDEGDPKGFRACVLCLNHKIGVSQRLRWTDSGRLTPYHGEKK